VSARGLCWGDVPPDVRLKAFEKDDLIREDPEAEVGDPSDEYSLGRFCIAGLPKALPSRAVSEVLRCRSAGSSGSDSGPVPDARRFWRKEFDS
jgi:hypothetical protein